MARCPGYRTEDLHRRISHLTVWIHAELASSLSVFFTLLSMAAATSTLFCFSLVTAARFCAVAPLLFLSPSMQASFHLEASREWTSLLSLFQQVTALSFALVPASPSHQGLWSDSVFTRSDAAGTCNNLFSFSHFGS